MRVLALKTHELDEREKALSMKSNDALAQFTQETDRRMKELALKEQELERREKALSNTPVITTQPQPQPQPQLQLSKSGTNNLETHMADMYKANQNTISKEMLHAIVSPLLMANLGTFALRANNPTTPVFKTYSTSNCPYIILDVQGPDGGTLLRHIVSKQLYSLK